MKRSSSMTYAGLVVCCGLSLCACDMILGIKDLKPPHKDGGTVDATQDHGDGSVASVSTKSMKDGSVSGSAGGSGSTSKSDGGTAGNKTKDAAIDSSVASDATTRDAAPSDAGKDAGHHVATDGATPATSQTVHGKLIDYWRHPLSGVPIAIGTSTTTTDADGAFTIADVTPPYDVALTISTQRVNTPAKFAWLFEGLTRADPTLQVYRGLPDRLPDHLNLSVTHATFPLTSSQKIVMDFASPDGEFTVDLDSAAVDYSSNTAGWVGPMITTGSAHALFWTFSGAQDLPVSYLAHDKLTVALNETSATNNIAFNLDPSAPLAVGSVAGTVTSPTTNNRANGVFVRFGDGAVIQVVDDSGAAGSFSYVVPSGLANASIAMAASEGYFSAGPFAVAYQDGLAPGQTGIALNVPTPATIVAPGAGASMVDETTTFQWTSSSKVFVFAALSDPTYDAFFVVTAKKEAKLPAFPVTDLALAANIGFTWRVETHGSYASMDEATSDAGLLDAFAYGGLRGPRIGAGSYTESERRSFTSKP